MKNRKIQEIMPFVEKPSRYLGCETNSIHKDSARIRLKFCLAFPDLYEIGTSHFGMQILYDILNRHPDISAQRVFAPGTDMEERLRKNNLFLTALESKVPLNDFDIIGFSLLYELNYTNILTMLDLSGIPFFASKRDSSHPFIIAGGPCAFNPEPVAFFFDAMVVGDGENVIMTMSRAFMDWKKEGSGDREGLLRMWSKIQGVYIPSFFDVEYDAEGVQRTTAKRPEYTVVKKAVLDSLEDSPFPESPVVPFGRPIHDRLRLEVARGCTRGCRFCQAGMIYRPVRERSVEKLVRLAEQSIKNTGYDDISLLSLSTGDYGQIFPLMEHLFCRYESKHIAISFPSVRAGTLTPELMRLIKRVRKTGFTIAPEAGSQRMRNVINKNISHGEIFSTVENAFKLGWNVIKLYFMIGLPNETDEDLMEVARMIKDLSKVKGSGKKRKKINVSITTFIPKPHTPFQWHSQLSLDESRKKFLMIQEKLKPISGVHLKWQNQEMSLLEGVFSRGDRRLAGVLVSAYTAGCRFDGWSENFNFELWKTAFKENGLNTEFYTSRQRDLQKPLPWDHIESGVTKDFLKKELEKSSKEETTDDCRQGNCHTCGVCDFKNISPKLSADPEIRANHFLENPITAKKEQLYYKLLYEKKDEARFLGHLETANIFFRAIRRAGIEVKYSKGFHPKPKIAFSNPIPVGMESLEESFSLVADDDIEPERFIEKLNENLPGGLVVTDCIKNGRVERSGEAFYSVVLHNEAFDQQKLADFMRRQEFTFSRPGRKGGFKKIDLKNIIFDIEMISKDRLLMGIKEAPEIIVRPLEVIAQIFKLPDNTIKMARVIKLPYHKRHV